MNDLENHKFQGLRGTSLELHLHTYYKERVDDFMISIEPKGIIIGYRQDYRYLQFRGFDGNLYYYESEKYKWGDEKYFASGNSKIY